MEKVTFGVDLSKQAKTEIVWSVRLADRDEPKLLLRVGLPGSSFIRAWEVLGIVGALRAPPSRGI